VWIFATYIYRYPQIYAGFAYPWQLFADICKYPQISSDILRFSLISATIPHICRYLHTFSAKISRFLDSSSAIESRNFEELQSCPVKPNGMF
jgi:hypothetical protein